MKISAAFLSLLFLFTTACSAARTDLAPLPTVEKVDINRYLGTWYEVASRPNIFQSGCVATKAVYSLRENGDLKIENSCHSKTLDGPLSTAEGHAWIVDHESNAKLKVSFFWPFKGDYWIVDLDANYQWVLVAPASRKYFWILSRTPHMDEALLTSLLKKAEELGLPVGESQRTLQP